MKHPAKMQVVENSMRTNPISTLTDRGKSSIILGVNVRPR